MRRFLRCEVHPDNPQARRLQAVADRLRAGAMAALPTAAGYLLACRLDDKAAAARLLRGMDERRPALLLCRDLAQAAACLHIDDGAFRAIRESRRGASAFLLRCTHGVPRRLAAAGGGAALLYFAGHAACQALLELLDQPLLALPPEAGVRDLQELSHELSHEQRALLEVALDAGPLAKPEAVDCVELFQPRRPGLGRWTGMAGRGEVHAEASPAA